MYLKQGLGREDFLVLWIPTRTQQKVTDAFIERSGGAMGGMQAQMPVLRWLKEGCLKRRFQNYVSQLGRAFF